MLRKALLLLAFPLLIIVAGPQDAAATATLQERIDGAAEGAIIYVEGGNFSDSGNFNVDFKGKGVTLEAMMPGNPPKLMLSSGQHGFIFKSGEGSGSKVIGFEIHNASVTSNGSNPYLGIYHNDGGGALIINSSPVIQDCLFVGCAAETGGGIAVIDSSSPQIIGCTFNNCAAASVGAAAYVFIDSTEAVTFSNNIIANSNEGYGVHASPFSSINFSCCCFWDNSPANTSGPCSLDANTIFQDPLFCDEPNDDFTIAGISPCAPANSPCGELIGARPVDCLGYVPGDVNDDELININDVTYLINYKYKEGPAPIPVESGDTNGDCAIDILDVVYLINFVYKGGPAPLPGCATPPAKISQQAVTAGLTVRYDSDSDRSVVVIESSVDLHALELETYSVSEIAATNLVDGMQIFAGHADGATQIGMFDMEGKGYIAAGNHAVIELAGQVESVSGVGVDANGDPVMFAASSGGGVILPGEFSLSQNHPNPFNPSTAIKFSLPEGCHVKLEVLNVLGQSVSTVVNGHLEAGAHRVHWDGNQFSSGVYFYRLTTGDFVETKKMVLLK